MNCSKNCYEKGCIECLGAMLKNAGRFLERMTSDDKLVNECQQTFEAENQDAIQEIVRVLQAGQRSPEKLEIRELSGGYFGETRSLAHTQVINLANQEIKHEAFKRLKARSEAFL
jgi:hypothetical protein